MPDHASPPPQLHLFEAQPAPSPRRGGIPRHMPTPESRLLANELKAVGATQETIARALGIGTSTLATHYLASHVGQSPKGRRRHAANAATRKIVRRAILGGMTQAKVAKLIGISVPTLRLYYRDELQP